MTLKEIVAVLEARVAVGKEHLDREINCAGAADMQSVILARGEPGMVLLTSQLISQTIHSCMLSDISAVVMVRGAELTPEAHDLAARIGMVVLTVPYTLYETCGRLYATGLPGVEID
ncbi:MAG: hypothetical protein JXA62_06770 [Candidatus Aminicenantes bacterium]|nr:hypothetical protein [Candidatus Aminicenantes bacterium]